MLDQLLKLQQQIIEYNQQFKEEITKVKVSMEKITEALNK